MLNLVLAATALLSVADPSGDMNGDGTYHLPTNMSINEMNSLDLRQFSAYDEDGKLSLEVGFAALSNPLQAPKGFSVAVVDIFIKSRVGGAEILADTGLNTPAGMGWQYHLNLTGFKTLLERVPNSSTIERMSSAGVVIRTKGANIHIKTPLPAGDYQYWVTSSLFDPLSATGVGAIQNELSPVQVSTLLNNPPFPVDILYSGDQVPGYLSRVYAPVGELVDVRPWVLLGLGLLGLMAGVIASVMLWNKRTVSF